MLNTHTRASFPYGMIRFEHCSLLKIVSFQMKFGSPEGRQKSEPYQSIKIRQGINIGNMGQLNILEPLVLGQSEFGDKLRCGGLV